MNLPHLASRLYGTPLLLARAKLDVILSVLGERVNWPESDLAVPSVQKRPSIDAPVGIAVIPVVGSLVRRTLGLDPASGFTSYAEIAGMVDAALADPSVEGIVLDIAQRRPPGHHVAPQCPAPGRVILVRFLHHRNLA